MNKNKWKERALKALITLATMIVFVCIVMMLFNALLNALPTALSALMQSLFHHAGSKFRFSPAFFFRPPKGVGEFVIFFLAFGFTFFFSKHIILRISQKVQSYVPMLRSTVEGSQRWATKGEIRHMLTAIPQSDIESADTVGILLASDKKNYYVETRVVHTLVIGLTGSGKDQLIALPTIRIISQGTNPENMVIFDLKGDMLENCYAGLKAKGYRIFVLNFDRTVLSDQWNPLNQIISAYEEVADSNGHDFSTAVELTNELALILTDNPKSDPVWPQSAKSLLVAIILFMLEDGYKKQCLDKLNLYSVYNFFVELGGREIKINNQSYNALDNLMSSLPVGHPAKMAYATSKFAVGEMRSSIFATLASNLQLFGDSGIAYVTGKDDIDFHALTDPLRPCAIFMVMPATKINRNLLATMFVSQCYSFLAGTADGLPGKKLSRRVHFILNEFGNMPLVPNMKAKISLARSQNIVFDLFVQNLQMIEDTYGTKAAATIQGNCGNWVYINSSDNETNKYISSLLGNETLEYTTYNGENGDILNRSRMEHLHSSPLLRPEDLSKLPEGEIIVIRQRAYPIHTSLPYFYKLGLPITPIEEFMERRPIDLDKLLYPISNIGVPGMPDISPQEAQAAEERSQKMLVQASINNLNILTGMAFGHALDSMDITQARAIIQKYLNEGNIDQKQVNALEAHLNSLQ